MTARDFEGMPHYLEWTWLALKLARDRKIGFLDRPTYRLNRTAPDSLSFSSEFVLGIPAAIRRILALPLPSDVKRILRHRLSQSLHNASDFARRSGDLREAWRSHLFSLTVGPSWRWLLYTRRLMIASGAERQAAAGEDRR